MGQTLARPQRGSWIGLRADPHINSQRRFFVLLADRIDVDARDDRGRPEELLPHPERPTSLDAYFEKSNGTTHVFRKQTLIDRKVVMPAMAFPDAPPNLCQAIALDGLIIRAQFDFPQQSRMADVAGDRCAI